MGTRDMSSLDERPLEGAMDWKSHFGDQAAVEHVVEPGTELTHEGVVRALRFVFDPEIPVNIYDLGLIYKLETRSDGTALIWMTLTSPNCPEAEALPERAQSFAQSVPGVEEARLELVWEPPWGPERMGEATRLELGFF